jgi:H+/Cl- antiporter ClcA
MNLDERVEHHDQRIRDATLEGNYQLWGALLATEGTMVSPFAVAGIAVESTRSVAAILTLLGIVAIAALIWNFKAPRDMYEWIGK